VAEAGKRLFGFFVHDDGHVSESYYRSDSTFEEIKSLQALTEVVRLYEAVG